MWTNELTRKNKRKYCDMRFLTHGHASSPIGPLVGKHRHAAKALVGAGTIGILSVATQVDVHAFSTRLAASAQRVAFQYLGVPAPTGGSSASSRRASTRRHGVRRAEQGLTASQGLLGGYLKPAGVHLHALTRLRTHSLTYSLTHSFALVGSLVRSPGLNVVMYALQVATKDAVTMLFAKVNPLIASGQYWR